MKERLKVKKIFDEQQVNDRFSKREVLFEYNDGRYDHDVLMQFTNGNVNHVNNIAVGDVCEVVFDIDTRYWEKGDRYFMTITAWCCDVLKSARRRDDMVPDKSFEKGNSSGDDDDDLPW